MEAPLTVICPELLPRTLKTSSASRLLALSAASLLCFASHSDAATSFVLTSGFYQDSLGAKVPDGTLFQLVNLGANGVFDPIDLNDGSTSGLSQWVSGDDSVFTDSFGAADYSSLAAFDLANDPAATAGKIDRTFTFLAPEGTKFGIRWFPGLSATNNIGSITLGPGQKYGQFTRQNDPNAVGPLYDGLVNGPDSAVYLWEFGADSGQSRTLDKLRTTDNGGLDLLTTGQAFNVVVPEPASLSLSFLGLGAVLSLRRRRS